MAVLLVTLFVIAADVAILSMIASGIDISLRAKYEEKEKALEMRERQMAAKARAYAKALYLDALRRTHIVWRTKVEVVDDPLGKDKAV